MNLNGNVVRLLLPLSVSGLSLFAMQDQADAACSLNADTWECSGTIKQQGVWQNGLYTSFNNAGIHVYSGDIKIHVLPDGLVTTAGLSASADAISNNYVGMSPGDVYSLYVLNDGQIIATNNGGSNFAVELSLASPALLGPVTFDNNGLIQGVYAAFSVNSDGLFTLNNSATGIVRANNIGLNLSGPGSIINNYGTIEVLNPDAGYALAGTAGTDIVSQYDGKIVGDILLQNGNDTFNWYGGTFSGDLLLGNGSDTVLVSAPGFDSEYTFDGGDDTSVSDGMVDQITFAGISANVKGANLLNWEIIAVENAHLTVLDDNITTEADAGYGLTVLNGGSVRASGGFTLDGHATLSDGGTLGLVSGSPGALTVNGDVENGGLLDAANGVVGNSLVVNGDYFGQGGQVQLDTALYDDNSHTDMLLVNGDTSGNSYLKVVNVDGAGAPTVEGIKVINVSGSSAGAFSLLGDYIHDGQQAVVGGAYAYKLYQGAPSTPSDGDWYLRSQIVSAPQPQEPNEPLYQAGVPSYEVYPRLLLGLNGLPTLQQRVGNRYWNEAGSDASAASASSAPGTENGHLIENNAFWARAEGAHNEFDSQTSTSETDFRYNTYKLQGGVDGLLLENESGKLISGVAVHYTRGVADTYSRHGDGDIRTDGFGLSGILTWYGQNGLYVDGQAQATLYNTDIGSKLTSYSLEDGNNGFGHAVSIESGKRYAIDDQWTLTPQAQLVYSNVRFNDFDDVFGAAVSLDRGKSLQGRLGLSVDRENLWQDEHGMPKRAHVYGIANLYYEFMHRTEVSVEEVDLVNRIDRLWGGVGLGGSYNWSDDKYSIYGEGSVSSSLHNFGDSVAYKATVGFRMKW